MAKKKAAQHPDPDAEAEAVLSSPVIRIEYFFGSEKPLPQLLLLVLFCSWETAPCCPSASHDHLSLSWYVRTYLALGLKQNLRRFGAQKLGSKSTHRFASDCEIFRVFQYILAKRVQEVVAGPQKCPKRSDGRSAKTTHSFRLP